MNYLHKWLPGFWKIKKTHHIREHPEADNPQDLFLRNTYLFRGAKRVNLINM